MSYYDDMERIAYPLVGTDDLGIPSDVLVDLQVQAPTPLGNQLQVLSCSITDLVVSVVLGINGVAVGYLTRPNALTLVHEPYEITPVVDGVFGFVVFGQGCKTNKLRVDGPYAVVPVCLVSYQAEVSPWTLMVGGHAVDGIVEIAVGVGLKIAARQLNLQLPTGGTKLTTALVISADSTQTLEEPVIRCQMRADGVLGDLPLRSINGIAPSTDGSMTIAVLSTRPTTTSPVITSATAGGMFKMTDPVVMCQGSGA